jgi:SAM-dependent methyltransferase
MTFDDRYAAAYDALYRDKDYAGECDYLEALFRKHGRTPRSVLDLGCGTGGHALVLSRRGYEVVGVDRSAAMLSIARRKADAAGLGIALVRGDIAGFRTPRKFDAAISMFSVMGYLADEASLSAALRAVREALAPGGLFLFDCWHGEAVAADPPVVRTRTFRLPGGGTARRTATPELDPAARTVRVEIRLETASGGAREETVERHLVRYFLPGELRRLLEDAGLAAIDILPFRATEGIPSPADWTLMVVAGGGSP